MINADFFILREATCHNYATGQSGHPLHLNKRHYLSLLFIALFGTYYHIIVHGGFIHLDDMNLLTRLLNESSFVLKDLFFVASGWYLTSVAFRISQLYKAQHRDNRTVPFLK